MKHTQGEWKTFVFSDGYSGIQVFGLPVIEVSITGQWIAYVRGNGLEETTANAKLIAAAPDLLEALIEMVENNVDTHHTHISKAEAAIKKATE